MTEDIQSINELSWMPAWINWIAEIIAEINNNNETEVKLCLNEARKVNETKE